MRQATPKQMVAALGVAALVVLGFIGTAHGAVHKAIGETSTATASCAEGCALGLRIVKGGNVVKDDVVPGSPWIWLDAWGTGTFTVECKCGDSAWHVIATYEVSRYNLPIVSKVEGMDSPISVWLPANFPKSTPQLRVWTYPHPNDYCTPWIWTNATLWWPKTQSANCSEADLSNNLGTRLVNVKAMLNSQEFAYGERQMTMAAQMTVTGLGGQPGTWRPSELLQAICQRTTQSQSQHFEFSTTVTSTVSETQTGDRTFSASGAENNTIPATMTAQAQLGVYRVQPDGGGSVGSTLMLSLEDTVGFHAETSRTLATNCSLALDVPANKQLTVLLGPQGNVRNGNYDYYDDEDSNGAAESEEKGAYNAFKTTGVYFAYSESEVLP